MTNLSKLATTNKVTRTSSFNGYEFDIESDVWVLNKNREINVQFIHNFDITIQDDIRSTLVYFAENKSSAHTANLCREIKGYFDNGFNIISELGLLSYKSRYSEKKFEYRVAVLRVFLKQIYYLEYKAVNEQLYELMNKWRLSGNEKGIAVLSLDPEEGPYSDIEFQAIKDGLDYRYAESTIDDEAYSLAQLFAGTGRRSIQIASLNIGDLRIDKEILELPTYILNIPKAKVRGRGFRAAFTDFALIESIGQVLERHIKNVIQQAERIIGRSLSEEEKPLIPLFPDDLRQLRGMNSIDVIEILKLDVTHRSLNSITRQLQQIINALNITSERTGKLLKTTAYRFRYTLGTRAAREGAGILTIATLLDHADTQNTKVYVANIPEHATTISQIMNGALMKYANAFQGKIVDSESQAKTENPDACRIRTNDSSDDVGSCGTSAMCQDYAPIACYICPKFRPWRDAPHHIVLKWLLEERQRILDETEDLEISAINDRAIIAVTHVIMLCQEKKDAKNG
ncbi:MAG: site-specific integrase [Pseudomonadota bacterium]